MAAPHWSGNGPASPSSTTLRDARVLWDHLLSHDDWDAAGHGYAKHHDQAYSVIHTVEHWLKDLLLATGPEAEARHAQALPLIGQDGTRMPDLFGLGPEVPIGATVRRRFFGGAIIRHLSTFSTLPLFLWRCLGSTPYNLSQSFCYTDLHTCLKQPGLTVTKPDEEGTRCQSTL